MSYLVHSIEGNTQRLDGGAMFGNVPRALWAEWISPDELHRIPLACRSFLIEDQARKRRILLEAGIGLFFEPKLQERFGVEGTQHQLLLGLAALQVEPGEIDAVVLSHLHFDHAGGLLSPWQPDGDLALLFPRARFIVGARAWERAQAPHLRDRASFIPQLHRLLQSSDRLELVEESTSPTLGPDFSFTFSDGHTPGMLLTQLQGEKGGVVFCADLIPGRPWLHLPVTMGYDRYPEKLIDEKRELLTRCQAAQTRLLFTHDPTCASCRVGQNDRGRFIPLDEIDQLAALKI